MQEYLLSIAITVFLICVIGYILVVIKEKFYLRNNIIVLDFKNLDQDELRNIDVKHFMLGSTELMAGDEIKVELDNSLNIKGVLLGVIKSENCISIATKAQGIKNLKISTIKKLKVVSKYGKFFTKF